jgi:hypothetical protein
MGFVPSSLDLSQLAAEGKESGGGSSIRKAFASDGSSGEDE